MKKHNRLLCVLLCVSVIFSLFSVSIMCSAEESALLGDVDGDGEITVSDARSVLRMASGIDEVSSLLADFDEDGIITSSDAQNILCTALGVPVIKKTGDNITEDGKYYPDNKYIKTITSKYKTIPAEALVAIYTDPESDSNFVLQFKKKSLVSKEYGRSQSDLEKVYQIDLNGNISVATKTGMGSEGCTNSESILIFYLVKNVMMPQNPEVFDIEE